MSRYFNANISKKRIKRGNSPYMYEITRCETIFYSSIPETDGDMYVISQPGDRLDLLANQYYGDISLWWYIAKANGLTFMTLKPGTSLRIPATTQYAIGK